MGSCVSVHKDPETAMKLQMSFGSTTEKLQLPSPTKEKPIVNGDPTAVDDPLKSHTPATFRDLGSKEETFFDSHPWLESDCEDDFYSVNGDFTPSRGSTPLHNSFSVGTPQINTFHYVAKPPNSEAEPSPKKRLSDLFKESLRVDHDNDDINAAGNQTEEGAKTEAKETTLSFPPQSANGTPYISGANSVCSSEKRTPIVRIKLEEKSINPVQCCLPRLRSSRSFNERKKKMSPIPSIGG